MEEHVFRMNNDIPDIIEHNLTYRAGAGGTVLRSEHFYIIGLGHGGLPLLLEKAKDEQAINRLSIILDSQNHINFLSQGYTYGDLVKVTYETSAEEYYKTYEEEGELTLRPTNLIGFECLIHLQNLRRRIGPYLPQMEALFDKPKDGNIKKHMESLGAKDKRMGLPHIANTLHAALLKGSYNCCYPYVDLFATDLFSGRLEDEGVVRMDYNPASYEDWEETKQAWLLGAYAGRTPSTGRRTNYPRYLIYKAKTAYPPYLDADNQDGRPPMLLLEPEGDWPPYPKSEDGIRPFLALPNDLECLRECNLLGGESVMLVSNNLPYDTYKSLEHGHHPFMFCPGTAVIRIIKENNQVYTIFRKNIRKAIGAQLEELEGRSPFRFVGYK